MRGQPVTSFHGRRAEIETVAGLLERARLVTLTGTPGIGKTRLALRVAAGSSAEVVFCDLSGATAAADVDRAIASALGIGPARTEDAAAIPDRLRALGRACVVLDHCEEVAEPVARALEAWLAVAEEARFLATSRALLRVPGEQAYEVPPLSADEACALFVDRARLARHDFDAAETTTIAAIARKLDGIPLAIELAAARMGVMSATTLLGKLDDALGVLDRTDREQTLRRALEALCAMLSTRERHALVGLAVFRGGFGVDAACEALGSPSGADMVQSLRERSLVHRVEGERFALYEIVRQFALGHLASGEARAEAEAAHERIFVARAERWVAPGPGRLSRAGLAALEVDFENVRAVYERRPSLAIALAWHSLLYARGEITRAREVLDRALAASSEDGALVGLALAFRVLHQRTRTTALEAARARADVQRARSIAAASDDAMLEALAVCALGYVAVQSGDDEAIGRLLPEAIAMQHAAGDDDGEMRTHRLIGTVRANQGRTAEAMRHFETALELARRVDPSSVAVYSGMIGCIHLGAGHLAEAERALREAADRVELEEHLEGAHFSAYLAVALQELGRFDEAEQRYAAAARTSRRQGDTRQLPITLHYWATLAHETGDLETAIARYREAASFQAGGMREMAACTHGALAAALAALGRTRDAKAELAEATHACRELGGPWKDVALVHGGHIALAESEEPATAERLGAMLASIASPPNEDLRFAIRLLRRRLASVACGLIVGPHATWFQVRTRARVSLERRKVLRALLEALATHASMSSDALAAEVWPNERMSRSAGRNRVHVAIAQLRALGLDDLIEHDAGLYRLAPGFRLEPG
ncbi:MAG TPA: tetratricopeptide repeat protein [Polyangiaceae bacterium]|jgi:predicted ATPase